MKNRLVVVLLGLFSFFGSAAVMAHSPGYGHAYAGVPLITIRGNYYEHSGYAGNRSLGFVGGYSNRGYANDLNYGHVQGYADGHRLHYGYASAYQSRYRHGHHNHHHGRDHNNHHDRHH